MVERLDLRPPSRWRQILEKIGLRVTPSDICPDQKTLDQLYSLYPDLAGDGTAIGPGDDCNCQSWQGDFGWWRELVGKQKK